MPRSFTCWNERRRPDPRLFAVPGAPPPEHKDAEEDSSVSVEGAAPIDELEQLIAGLLEDGNPLLKTPWPLRRHEARRGRRSSTPSSPASSMDSMPPCSTSSRRQPHFPIQTLAIR